MKRNIFHFNLFVFILLMYGLPYYSNGQSGVWGWVKPIHGNDEDLALRIASDSLGNVYTTVGFYSDSVLVGGTYHLKNTGWGCDFVITKLNANGDPIWNLHLGDQVRECASDICIAPNGGLYVYGWFDGPQFNLDNNWTLINSNYPFGGSNLFILKLTHEGQIEWAKSFGNGGVPNRMFCKKDGTIYLTGKFWGNSFTMDTVTLVTNTSPQYCLFTLKIDLNGSALVGRSFKILDSIQVTDIYVDDKGNSLVTGSFNSATLSFGGVNVNKISAFSDCYVLKYKLDNDPPMIKTYENSAGTGVCGDSSGNIYLTGKFGSSIQLGSILLTSTSNGGGFYVKLDSNLVEQWAQQVCSITHYTTVWSSMMRLDQDQNVIGVGLTARNLTIGTSTYTYEGKWDSYIVKLDKNNGNIMKSQYYGGKGDDFIHDLHIGLDNQVYVGGEYKDSTTHVGGTTFLNAGKSDGFVAKLNFNFPTINQTVSISKTIVLFPNPASDEIAFDLHRERNILFQLQVFDSKGRLINSYSCFGLTPKFNLGQLPCDLYTYKLMEEAICIQKGLVLKK